MFERTVFTSLIVPKTFTDTPAGKILFTMISAYAEFERAIICERVIVCMEKARARDAKIGRPKIPLFTIEKVL